MKKLLKRLHACVESIQWVGGRTPEQAWVECERAEWMLWLLEHKPRLTNKRTITLIACDIAETALKFVPPGEDRPRLAIEAARDYIAGKITIDQLNAAMAATWAAVDAAWAAGAAGAAGAAWAAWATSYLRQSVKLLALLRAAPVPE